MGQAGVCCAALLLLVASASLQVQARSLIHSLNKRGSHYCGSELVEILSLTCDKAGISIYTGKRTATEAIYQFGHSHLATQVGPPYRYESIHHPQKRVKRHGIVEECCYKPCTFNDIMNYCKK